MYQLRWCFQYLDGKTKVGLWSNPGAKHLPDTQAWCQPTNDLAAACIEGRYVTTQKVMVMADVRGQDFCTFQWIGTVPLSHGKHIPRVRGLVLVGRDIQYSVFDNGKVSPSPRTWKDNIMMYGREK